MSYPMLENIDQYVWDNMFEDEDDNECYKILEVINILLVPDPLNRLGIREIFLNHDMFQNMVDHSQEKRILEPACVDF